MRYDAASRVVPLGAVSVTVRIVGAVVRRDAGRVPPVLRVPERLGRHLVRAVRVVGAVGRREAGRVTGLGVRDRADGRRRVMAVMVVRGRVTLVAGRRRVVLAVVVVVVAAGGVVRVGLRVRGQQRVVAVRIVGTQRRVQAGRVPRARQHHRRLDRENRNGLQREFKR